MFTSFLVVLLCCVGFSVGQETFDEDAIIYIDDEIYTNTEHPDMFTPRDCAPNEIYTYSCHPEPTCRYRGNQVTTLTFTEEVHSCEDKCVCEPGFFRNTENGVCISEKQCDKCPGANEHYACDGPCDNICHTLHLFNKTSCPGYNYSDCQPSCYCDDGYARNASGVCIPIDECPTPKCGLNEIYTECKKSCLTETCSSIINPPPCESEEQCSNQGCICQDGFIRMMEDSPCEPFYKCRNFHGLYLLLSGFREEQ